MICSPFASLRSTNVGASSLSDGTAGAGAAATGRGGVCVLRVCAALQDASSSTAKTEWRRDDVKECMKGKKLSYQARTMAVSNQMMTEVLTTDGWARNDYCPAAK